MIDYNPPFINHLSFHFCLLFFSIREALSKLVRWVASGNVCKELFLRCETALFPANSAKSEQVLSLAQFHIVAAVDGLHVRAEHDLGLRCEGDPTVGDAASENLEGSWTGLGQENSLSYHL